MDMPCKAYRRTPRRRSIYTHPAGTDVCAVSSAPFSFVFPHFLCQIVQALVMLRLRDRAVLQKAIEQRLLPQEHLMVFLLIRERGPFSVFDFHTLTAYDYTIPAAG